ncbi:hypothetical protein DPMN_064762 [Dreissena polymorpha]|uniref:Uncharacterized protein n=1 Tax=Dreissena polymorpha TaxID=45954 RepID=A0A9D4CEE6_DREPO|nr:hypothetical protein DPMN_064762 [Dreissena polymorpha]
MWSHVPQTQLQLSTHYVVTCTAYSANLSTHYVVTCTADTASAEHVLCVHMYRRLSFS